MIGDLIELRPSSKEPTVNYLKEARTLPKMEKVTYE